MTRAPDGREAPGLGFPGGSAFLYHGRMSFGRRSSAWILALALAVGIADGASAQPADPAQPPAPPGAPDPGAPAPAPPPPGAPAPLDPAQPAAPAAPAAPGDPAPATPAPAAPAPSPDEPALPETRGGPAPPQGKKKLAPRTDLAPGEKREPQDYDGREDETSAAEDALWLPRVVFFPAYLVAEYILRIPLGELTIAVEQNNVVSEVINFFTFGPNNNIGIIPTGFLDFGFRPSVGVFFFWNDFIAPGNDLRASFGFGGIKFWKFGIADRIPFVPPRATERSRSFFQMEADFLTRADLLYYGIGPATLEEDESGYGITTYGGGGRIHVEPWRGTFFEGWVTSRRNRSGAGECGNGTVVVDPEAGTIARGCDPPTLRRRILDGELDPPPGYGRPYTTVKSGGRIILDSRDERPAPGNGVAFDVDFEHASDVESPDVGSWLNYGASLAGFWDITGKQRVLSLTLTARFLNPIGDYVVPFTEYIGIKRNEDVPDGELMKGFRPGRLVGSSATAATVSYHWPVWAFLDGVMEAAVGNVWNEPHMEDFDAEKLRFSFVGGIRSPNHRDHSFNLLLGFGTETFEDGAKPNSLRFLFGGTTGF